ncbi:MAG: phosphatase PAP2 family protein [Solobacterium sp.]|nr:phosphatase PAP2 family protein [Solobacterium sp.]
MKKLLRWCNTHPVYTLVGYYMLYLCWFYFAEYRNPVPKYIIHAGIDDIIPFSVWAVIPYASWAPFIFFSLLLFVLYASREELWRLAVPMMCGMVLTVGFYLFVPTGLNLRPETMSGPSFLVWIVELLHKADTPTNVCPSIHVFISFIIDQAWQRSTLISGERNRWKRILIRLWDLAIILSTLFLKQHSVIDVIAGMAVGLLLDYAGTHMNMKKLREYAEI